MGILGMLLGTMLGTTFWMMLGAMLAPFIPPSWGKRCKTHPRSSRGGGKAGSSQRGVRAQRALLEGGGQPTPGSASLQLSPKIISPAAVFLLVWATSFSFSEPFPGGDPRQGCARRRCWVIQHQALQSCSLGWFCCFHPFPYARSVRSIKAGDGAPRCLLSTMNSYTVHAVGPARLRRIQQ